MMKHVMLMSLWDNSLEGKLLSLGQCRFCFLSGRDFKHYIVVALMCCNMHSLYRCW